MLCMFFFLALYLVIHFVYKHQMTECECKSFSYHVANMQMETFKNVSSLTIQHSNFQWPSCSFWALNKSRQSMTWADKSKWWQCTIRNTKHGWNNAQASCSTFTALFVPHAVISVGREAGHSRVSQWLCHLITWQTTAIRNYHNSVSYSTVTSTMILNDALSAWLQVM